MPLQPEVRLQLLSRLEPRAAGASLTVIAAASGTTRRRRTLPVTRPESSWDCTGTAHTVPIWSICSANTSPGQIPLSISPPPFFPPRLHLLQALSSPNHAFSLEHLTHLACRCWLNRLFTAAGIGRATACRTEGGTKAPHTLSRPLELEHIVSYNLVQGYCCIVVRRHAPLKPLVISHSPLQLPFLAFHSVPICEFD